MKEKRIVGVLVDVEKEMFGLVEIPNDLDAFYKVLNCGCIDIVTRRIGDSKKAYDIVCDDEGLLKEPHKISAVDSSGNVQLVGNIFITGTADKEGNLTSLPMDDANYIFDKVRLARAEKFENPYPILTQCEYA